MSQTYPSVATDKLSQLRPNSTFLAIHGYKNEFQELADHSVCFHINYLMAVRKSKLIVEDFKPSIRHCINQPFSLADLIVAKEELIHSYSESLTGKNSRYTCSGVYDQVKNVEGNLIPGIKLHKKDGVIHLEGYRIAKRIISPGIYPITNSASLTIAKNFLRKMTPLDKWGQFKLVPRRFDRISVEKLTIKDHDTIREVLI